jgi:hypothetical protein
LKQKNGDNIRGATRTSGEGAGYLHKMLTPMWSGRGMASTHGDTSTAVQTQSRSKNAPPAVWYLAISNQVPSYAALEKLAAGGAMTQISAAEATTGRGAAAAEATQTTRLIISRASMGNCRTKIQTVR